VSRLQRFCCVRASERASARASSPSSSSGACSAQNLMAKPGYT
jgi:hypothetical protein